MCLKNAQFPLNDLQKEHIVMKKIAVLLVALLVLSLTCTAMAEAVSIAIVYSDTVDD